MVGTASDQCVPFETLTQALEDILEHIARIERFVGNLDEIEFREDERTMFAVHCSLLAVSAVAVRLGVWADILSADVPWHRIRELGARLRPGYDRVDASMLWRTVQDLAGLQLSAMRALNQLEDQDRLEWL
jgi:uncharacterized protein with HEPN domain